MRATVLIDNLASVGLSCEWGLSILVEHAGRRVLLDTGASGLFAENADALGADLARVDAGVLSHAHFDHSDGMAEFFRRNASAPFYLRDGARCRCYNKRWPFDEYIGIHKGWLEKYADRIVYVSGDREILPGVWLVPHKTPGLEEIGRRARFRIRVDGRKMLDDFRHEQSLVVDLGPDGLVVFNSCSHAGADTVVREAMTTFPGRPVRAVVGGFHLFRTPDDEVRAFARRVRETGVGSVYTGHCTGDRAFGILREELGERAVQLRAGLSFEC